MPLPDPRGPQPTPADTLVSTVIDELARAWARTARITSYVRPTLDPQVTEFVGVAGNLFDDSARIVRFVELGFQVQRALLNVGGTTLGDRHREILGWRITPVVPGIEERWRFRVDWLDYPGGRHREMLALGYQFCEEAGLHPVWSEFTRIGADTYVVQPPVTIGKGIVSYEPVVVHAPEFVIYEPPVEMSQARS